MSYHAYSDSPCSFLSLPPDVRVEVYKELLGQKTLHFNDFFPELGNGGVFLCNASSTDLDVFGDGQHLRVAKLPQSELGKALRCRHANCYKGWPGLDLQFLLACRLVYQEACLVPFAENTFTFPSREMVARFVARLMPWQAKAVDKIILYQQDWWRYWLGLPDVLKPPDVEGFSPAYPPFRNLRRLTIFIEYAATDANSIGTRNPGDRPDLVSADYQDAIVAAMKDLVSERLETLNLAMLAFDCLGGEASHVPLDMVAVEAWALRTRKSIVQMAPKLKCSE